MDRVDFVLPEELKGRDKVSVRVAIDGVQSNPVVFLLQPLGEHRAICIDEGFVISFGRPAGLGDLWDVLPTWGGNSGSDHTSSGFPAVPKTMTSPLSPVSAVVPTPLPAGTAAGLRIVADPFNDVLESDAANKYRLSTLIC